MRSKRKHSLFPEQCLELFQVRKNPEAGERKRERQKKKNVLHEENHYDAVTTGSKRQQIIGDTVSIGN